MVALIIFLVVVGVSILITRIAGVALVHTGLSEEAARFQARSAFSGVGFTTAEAESVVDHPVRRRIVHLLMLMGNAGLVTAISTLVLTFVDTPAAGDAIVRGGVLLAGLAALLLAARSDWADRRLSELIDWALECYTDLRVADYSSLLKLQEDFGVGKVQVREGSWLTGKTLEEAKLAQEGLLVLGLERDDAYVGAPHGDDRVQAGDVLVLYGATDSLQQLGERRAGSEGDAAHARRIEEFQESRRRDRA